MKNNLKLAFFILAVIAITGCVAKQKPSEQSSPEGKIDQMGRKMPDFGQPEGQAEIRGLVTGIVGNEVTVLKIERPEAVGKRGETDDKKKTLSTGGTPRIPGMGMRKGGASNEDDKSEMIEKMKEMGADEVTVTIPVGVQMLKPDTTTEGAPEMLEANLSDIEKDAMISIWTNKNISDKQVASFVLVMN